MAFGPIEPQHYARVLALNEAHVEKTSALTRGDLHDMVRGACWTGQQADGGDAFAIAFDEGAAYASPNFRWFRDRLKSFVYVDRIVVAAHARRRGIGRALYAAVTDCARRTGRPFVACEVNVAPPNPGSDAFHGSLGFVELGRAVIHGGAKTVRYLVLSLPQVVAAPPRAGIGGARDPI